MKSSNTRESAGHLEWLESVAEPKSSECTCATPFGTRMIVKEIPCPIHNPVKSIACPICKQDHKTLKKFDKKKFIKDAKKIESSEWYESLFDTDRDTYFKIKDLLVQQRRELRKIVESCHDDMTGCYDYEGIAEKVLELIK